MQFCPQCNRKASERLFVVFFGFYGPAHNQNPGTASVSEGFEWLHANESLTDALKRQVSWWLYHSQQQPPLAPPFHATNSENSQLQSSPPREIGHMAD